MSLEHALLDRLEKRSLQVAQQENEINGLRQIRNEMQHRIAELQTERDRILEISKSLVPNAALKQAVQEAAELRSEVVKLRAEVETLKHERDSAINECERLRAESKETIGDLRAQVDARLIERLSRQQAPLQVLYKELLSMREALGSKLRASVDKTTEALRGVAANETAQTKMHEGEVPQQGGCKAEPEALDD